MKDAVVLLSSGLDSTTNLYLAHQTDRVRLVLTFNYGQKAAKKETQQAAKICASLGLPHLIIDVPWFQNFTSSSLINPDEQVPQEQQVQISQHEQSMKTAKSVWVPNRNGIFLNIAAGFAESHNAEWIIPGFNIEEASTFPDNSAGFMKALNHSFSYSTSNGVKVLCPTVELNKIEIMKLAIDLHVPLEDLWPCYLGHEKWCGQCESCLRFKRALAAHQIQLESYFLSD